MSMPKLFRRPGALRVMAPLAFGSLLLLAGCSRSAPPPPATSSPTGASPTPSPSVSPVSAYQQYCDKNLVLETYPQFTPSNPGLTAQQRSEELKRYATGVLGAAEAVLAAAPEQIKADLQTYVNSVRTTSQTGKAAGGGAVAQAYGRVHAFDLANCGRSRVEITATEYSLQGIPQTLKPGPANFALINRGKEPHELLLFRINDDLKDPAANLLKLPEAEILKRAVLINRASARPGVDNYLVADLKPGRYAIGCFIPVGGKSGPSHVTRGEIGEFTVS